MSLLVGCGQSVVSAPVPSDGVADVVEGSRLRALRWVPEDGAIVTVPGSFEDSGFDGARCSLSARLQGPEARCFPGGFVFLGPAYEDAACTQSVVPADLCAGVIVAERVTGVVAEEDVLRAYRPTAEPSAGPARFRVEFTRGLATSGTCGPLADAEASDFYAWTSGALVRAERLDEGAMVALVEESIDDLGDGLEEVFQRFEDGTVARFLRPQTDCTARSEDGVLRCASGESGGQGPVLRRVAEGEGRLQVVRLVDEAGRVWPVASGDRSVPLGIQGPLLDAFAPTYRDTRLGIDCLPERTVAGVLCLPLTTVELEAPGDSRYYLDAECSEPLASASGETAATVTHAARRRAPEPCERRAPVERVERLGAPLALDTPLYAERDGGCELADRVTATRLAWRLPGEVEDLSGYAGFRETPIDE
ncbi:MAG: hypothetical protein AAF447_02215 [Myxococcota bacterium]